MTWFAPPAILAIGAAATVALARRIVDAVDGVDRARRRTRRLEDALIPVRVETRRARNSIARMARR